MALQKFGVVFPQATRRETRSLLMVLPPQAIPDALNRWAAETRRKAMAKLPKRVLETCLRED